MKIIRLNGASLRNTKEPIGNTDYTADNLAFYRNNSDMDKDDIKSFQLYIKFNDDRNELKKILRIAFGEKHSLYSKEFADRVVRVIEAKHKFNFRGSDDLLKLSKQAGLVEEWREAPPFIVVKKFQ